MKTTVVRYKVKSDRAEENVAYIQRVFEQLQRESPDGLRYCSFQLEDGLSFLHIAAVDDSLKANPLTGISAFKDFASNIAERCEEPPRAVSARLIGAYETFGA
jgi:hypothetical protein